MTTKTTTRPTFTAAALAAAALLLSSCYAPDEAPTTTPSESVIESSPEETVTETEQYLFTEDELAAPADGWSGTAWSFEVEGEGLFSAAEVTVVELQDGGSIRTTSGTVGEWAWEGDSHPAIFTLTDSLAEWSAGEILEASVIDGDAVVRGTDGEVVMSPYGSTPEAVECEAGANEASLPGTRLQAQVQGGEHDGVFLNLSFLSGDRVAYEVGLDPRFDVEELEPGTGSVTIGLGGSCVSLSIPGLSDTPFYSMDAGFSADSLPGQTLTDPESGISLRLQTA